MNIVPYTNPFSEVDSVFCKNLVNQWDKAAADGTTKEGLLKLSDDTTKLITHLNKLSKIDDKAELKELKKITREAFENLSKDSVDKLITLIVENTSNSSESVLKVFHELNSVTAGKKTKKNSILNVIDETSAMYVRGKSTTLDLSSRDVEKLVYDQLSDADLLAAYHTSKGSQNIIRPVLIDRVIKGKVTLRQIIYPTTLNSIRKPTVFHKIGSSDDIKSGKAIVDFFGSCCEAITNLNLKECHELEDTKFLESFPNLEALDLSSCIKITGLDSLTSLTKLQELNLTSCGIQNPQGGITNLNFVSKLPNLQKLDLSNLNLHDWGSLKNLKSCQKLRILDLKGSNVNQLSFLLHCQNLQVLDLSLCKNAVEQLGIIKFCKNLHDNLGWLNLSYSKFNIMDLHNLRFFKNLYFLDLANLKTSNFKFLGTPFLQHSLQYIDISGAGDFNASRSVENDFSTLLELKNLKKVDAYRSAISDEISQDLKDRGVKFGYIRIPDIKKLSET